MRTADERFIPACAGNTCKFNEVLDTPRVYRFIPACAGNTIAIFTTAIVGERTRFIPACAGNTPYEESFFNDRHAVGSSPPVRGTPWIWCTVQKS